MTDIGLFFDLLHLVGGVFCSWCLATLGYAHVFPFVSFFFLFQLLHRPMELEIPWKPKGHPTMERELGIRKLGEAQQREKRNGIFLCEGISLGTGQGLTSTYRGKRGDKRDGDWDTGYLVGGTTDLLHTTFSSPRGVIIIILVVCFRIIRKLAEQIPCLITMENTQLPCKKKTCPTARDETREK
ncbi:hypothetical protein LX36DRAFT_21820 [Colletotrichum falcatum]|nr:hypothetical protein LX36DRAFT_21820 [Colletotrichum falcatum]